MVAGNGVLVLASLELSLGAADVGEALLAVGAAIGDREEVLVRTLALAPEAELELTAAEQFPAVSGRQGIEPFAAAEQVLYRFPIAPACLSLRTQQERSRSRVPGGAEVIAQQQTGPEKTPLAERAQGGVRDGLGVGRSNH